MNTVLREERGEGSRMAVVDPLETSSPGGVVRPEQVADVVVTSLQAYTIGRVAGFATR